MQNYEKKHIIKKRNILNEIRSNSMTLQELRFFSIYLSKINSNDPKTRIVRFSIFEFQSIMELRSLVKVSDMKIVTNSLLCKVVNIPDERGGYRSFQLFKECVVSRDDGIWYIEIDAHDKALPLMFEFKTHYFSYSLWNALRLKSSNQLRMYEILKQYEKVGERILTVDELKELLGIGKNEYTRFGDFKNRVLDVCQQALSEQTDIKFSYESYGKKGKGGKILRLKFTIKKNSDHKDKITLNTFIDDQEKESHVQVAFDDISDYEFSKYDERINFFREACNNEFSTKEIMTLFDKIRDIQPHLITNDLRCYHYISDRYNEMLMRNEKCTIKSRFGYVKSLIGVEL